MRTRNRLCAKSETGQATNQPLNLAKNDRTPPAEKPSPPRLRDRRPAPTTTMVDPTCSTTPSLEPSKSLLYPPAEAAASKRSSPAAPARVLPRRACGKPVSLLASMMSAHQSSAPNHILAKSNHVPSDKVPDDRAKSRKQHEPDLQFNHHHHHQNHHQHSDRRLTNSAGNYQNESDLSSERTATGPIISENASRPMPKPVVRITLPDKSPQGKTELTRINTNKNPTDTFKVTLNGLQKVTQTVPNSARKSAQNSASLCGEPQQSHPGTSDRSLCRPRKSFNVLIGVTGSVATIKLIELIEKLMTLSPASYTSKTNGTIYDVQLSIRVIMTQNSKHFTPKSQLKDHFAGSSNNSHVEIFDDQDEWSQWKQMNDPVLHIELRKWADVMVIAPLDANTMAKMANGICDNLLTCVVRAWDVSKHLIYCPAMNVHMYDHPITREQLSKLDTFGYQRVDCVEKRLACGDVGMGAMAHVDTIAKVVISTLSQPLISKPLLKRQPTYPIVSRPDDPEGWVYDRFRSNNQITVHTVSSTPAKRLKPAGDLNHASNMISNRSSNGDFRSRTTGVTSVRNLRALTQDIISSDDGGDANQNLYDDDDFGPDIDPSILLEQTMTTDEIFASEAQELRARPTGTIPNGRQIVPEGGAALESGASTPLLNTSKFLALCYNKERGCFTCVVCKHDYKNRKSMARHLKEQHVQGNIFHCHQCGVSYKRREKLIKHNRDRHPGKM